MKRKSKISIILIFLLIIFLLIFGAFHLIVNNTALNFDPIVKTIYTQIDKSKWNLKKIDKYATPMLRKSLANNPESASAFVQGMNSLGPIKKISGITSFDINYSSKEESAVLNNIIIFDKGARLFVTRLVKVDKSWYLDAFKSYVLSNDLRNITTESIGTYIINLNKKYLGDLYAKGTVLPKNTKKAISLFYGASDEGYTMAMFNIGARYYNGNLGLPKNNSMAIDWFQKGISYKCKSSKYCYGKICSAHALGLIYLRGNIAKKNLDKARELFKKSIYYGFKYNNFSKIFRLTNKDSSKIATKYSQYMLSQKKSDKNASKVITKEQQLNAGIENYCETRLYGV